MWQPPVFEDQNGVIIYYQLIVSQSQFEIPDITVNANTTSHTLTNLEEHVEYTVVVAAATRIGVGPFSSAVNFSTLQDGKSPLIILTANYGIAWCRWSWGALLFYNVYVVNVVLELRKLIKSS